MTVVADTSPLNYLVLLGHIEILAKIYGEVVVPQTVLDELRDSEAPAEVRVVFGSSGSIKAERLIIDDLEGRREAVHRGLPVIGTLGLLAEGARRNLLDLPRALEDLQATNFHVSPKLIELLLANDVKRRGAR